MINSITLIMAGSNGGSLHLSSQSAIWENTFVVTRLKQSSAKWCKLESALFQNDWWNAIQHRVFIYDMVSYGDSILKDDYRKKERKKSNHTRTLVKEENIV